MRDYSEKELLSLKEKLNSLIRNPVFISGYTCSSMGPKGEEFICEEGDICEYVSTDSSYSYYNTFYNHTKKLTFYVEGFPVRQPTSKLVKELFS